MADERRLLLLDTYGLVYRAFFALPPLTTVGGVPINAAYGFTTTLVKILENERPTHAIAAFDRGLPAHRMEMMPQYKAQREAMPDELRSQFALVRRVLEVFGIPIAELDGNEADDIIATLAAQAERAGAQTLVVTGDNDLLQIVDDATMVLATRRSVTDLVRYDRAAVRERYGLSPEQLADYRGLKGDPSDNLPGIPGIGEKTAIALMQSAGTLDALLADPSLAGKPRWEALVREYGEQARLCRDVSKVDRNLPVTLDWDAARLRPPDAARQYALYRELEFRTLLRKLEPPPSDELPLMASLRAPDGAFRSYVAAVDPPDFVQLCGELRAMADAARVALAIEGDALGASAAPHAGLAFHLDALRGEPIRSALEAALQGAGAVVGYDTKRIVRAFDAYGVRVPQFADDAMLAAHLLEPSRSCTDPAEAALLVLDEEPVRDAAVFADIAARVARRANELLGEREQLALYREVELPLPPILARMEEAGIAIDADALHAFSLELTANIATLAERVVAAAGEPVNIGSPQQLGRVLFEKLGIPGGKKNKTGWATGAEVLQPLAREYRICADILEWRELTKLKNTYVDVLPALRDPKDGRVHTVFNQTVTATGRLSSTNPNLQNIPVRAGIGRRIRRAFVASAPGRLLLSADYSQIELRLMAHLSGDEAMRRAFREGIDIHDFTAREIFGLAPGMPIESEQRRMAKVVNFGLLYGMSDFGLAARLEIDRTLARSITERYFARFPSVRAYIAKTLERGRENGYVSTILGRRRYMPALKSSNAMLRNAAEREATNAPLQGSAADLMKLAMIRVDRALRESGEDAVLLLQIHDELLIDVAAEARDRVAAIAREAMVRAMELSVPLDVSVKAGANWAETESFDA
ncbi:MAG: DNA polymerase I [Candidatus Eremiobacteraeota bacterium]|nr:DNA polymerase I [Candidatus Eremiobacteraeota bacterium]